MEWIQKLVAANLGPNKENPKFDFKAKWYDLTKDKGISEFY